jgi:hypothetical protein
MSIECLYTITGQPSLRMLEQASVQARSEKADTIRRLS